MSQTPMTSPHLSERLRAAYKQRLLAKQNT